MRGPHSASESLGTESNMTIGRLKRRADFLHVAKGRRWHGKALTLQAQARGARENVEPGQENDPARAGFTVTKKVGCSVVRNRARRRLREALRLAQDLPLRPGHDYVIVARTEAIRLDFTILQDELARALRSVHAEAKPRDAAKRHKRTAPSS